jgi:hypothetical protein
VALIVMLTLLTLCCLTLLLSRLSAAQLQANGLQTSQSALARAKQELIADAIFRKPIVEGTRLRLPDLGEDMSHNPTEGIAAVGLAGITKDVSVLGKFPWNTLHSEPLRDTTGECLWYAVSGRFKTTPQTDTFNWDTPGQLDVIDRNGNPIAANQAALIIAPGPVLPGQDRALNDSVYRQCGGNYDAVNYLDPFDTAYAFAGSRNYFSGTNHRVTPDAGNVRFVLPDSRNYNDQFVAISSNDVFDLLIKHKDFATAVSTMLGNPDFSTIPIIGSKGTSAFVCPNKDVSCKQSCEKEPFCENWKEMLFLTELKLPSKVTVDSVLFTTCQRVLIFSGRSNASQTRGTAVQKNDKKQYLEGVNLTSFSVPTAMTPAAFSGISVFDWRRPDADVIRCLP